MLREIALLLLAFQSSWMVPVAFGTPAPDDLTVKLRKHATNYNLGVFNFVEALIRVSSDFQIPMGIAWVNTPAARAELPFAWKDATVQEIIEAIAKTQPGYQVQVRSGVVYVSPPGLIPDRQNFLKLKIETFEVHDAYIEVASIKLHMLVTPRIYGQISIGVTGDSKVDVELKNSTVEEALGALVLASNRKVWIVTFIDGAGLTPRGLRRTESLWSDKPQPDEEQPGWDLLRWGDPMPHPSPTTK
jgi:hypothetical protein